MAKKIIKIKTRRNASQKAIVQEAIKATLSKNGVVVSHATSVKEICAASSYNRSVEVPICGRGKLTVS